MITRYGDKSLIYKSQWALFSECDQYRYALGRRWDDRLGVLVSILLNPATADQNESDATNTRGETRARRLGYGTNFFLNLFAYRSVSPQVMKAQSDPIGPENDEIIRNTLADMTANDMLLVGWGNHGAHMDRDKHVLRMVQEAGVTAYMLGANKSGTPIHPLYVSYDVQPVPFR